MAMATVAMAPSPTATASPQSGADASEPSTPNKEKRKRKKRRDPSKVRSDERKAKKRGDTGVLNGAALSPPSLSPAATTDTTTPTQRVQDSEGGASETVASPLALGSGAEEKASRKSGDGDAASRRVSKFKYEVPEDLAFELDEFGQVVLRSSPSPSQKENEEKKKKEAAAAAAAAAAAEAEVLKAKDTTGTATTKTTTATPASTTTAPAPSSVTAQHASTTSLPADGEDVAVEGGTSAASTTSAGPLRMKDRNRMRGIGGGGAGGGALGSNPDDDASPDPLSFEAAAADAIAQVERVAAAVSVASPTPGPVMVAHGRRASASAGGGPDSPVPLLATGSPAPGTSGDHSVLAHGGSPVGGFSSVGSAGHAKSITPVTSASVSPTILSGGLPGRRLSIGSLNAQALGLGGGGGVGVGPRVTSGGTPPSAGTPPPELTTAHSTSLSPTSVGGAAPSISPRVLVNGTARDSLSPKPGKAAGTRLKAPLLGSLGGALGGDLSEKSPARRHRAMTKDAQQRGFAKGGIYAVNYEKEGVHGTAKRAPAAAPQMMCLNPEQGAGDGNGCVVASLKSLIATRRGSQQSSVSPRSGVNVNALSSSPTSLNTLHTAGTGGGGGGGSGGTKSGDHMDWFFDEAAGGDVLGDGDFALDAGAPKTRGVRGLRAASGAGDDPPTSALGAILGGLPSATARGE